MTLSVLRWAGVAPRRVAAVLGGEELTYEALAGRVRRAIGWLRAHGVAGAPARVALVAAHDPDVVVMLLAAMELGAAVVPLHARWLPEQRARASRLVSADVLVPSDWARSARAREARGAVPVPTEATADLALVFTSGSTGEPRPVRLSRGAFAASARGSAANLGWQEADRWLLCLPLAHVGGLSVVVRAVLAGSCVVVPEPEALGGSPGAARALARALRRDRVTLLSLVPAQLAALLDDDASAAPPAALRAVLLGGAGASPALVARGCTRGWPLLRTYGLTEACSQVATQPLAEAGHGAPDCGPPLPGFELAVRSDGAIAVRGAALASGVLGDARPLTDASGWLVTGDAGTLDAAGRLRVLGRRTEMIVTGGENVWPAEVERALEATPGVHAARVVGLPDERWGERVAAVIATPLRDARELERLADEAGERLPPHCRPRVLAAVEALPLGASGKPDDARVRELVRTCGVAVGQRSRPPRRP